MAQNKTIDKGGASDKRKYLDLHEHIEALREKGLLIEVDRPINKDTEMHPLVRWQFRGEKFKLRADRIFEVATDPGQIAKMAKLVTKRITSLFVPLQETFPLQ